MSQSSPGIDQFMAQMRAEFVGDTDDRLDRLQELTMGSVAQGPEALRDIYREAHSLKGSGGTFGFPTISLICHKFEEYIEQIDELAQDNVSDILAYVDTLRQIVQHGSDPGEAEGSRLLRDLPAPCHAEFEVAGAPDFEVLLITQSKSIDRIVSRELRACGYRVTMADTFGKGLQFAAVLGPDLIITSAVLKYVSGVDLANALRAMAPTRNIPVAVLTSFSDDHHSLRDLPDGTPLIHLNSELSDDLANVMARFFGD